MACPSDSQIQKVTLVIILVIRPGNQEARERFLPIQIGFQNQIRGQKASFNSSVPVLTSVFTCELLCSILKHSILVFSYTGNNCKIFQCEPVAP